MEPPVDVAALTSNEKTAVEGHAFVDIISS